MQKYSIFSLIKNALSNHQIWDVAWKDPEPKKEYDSIIIGGVGHGLATDYYLAKEHKITNIAILEKHKIEHGFFCDNYPQLPSDAFTIFLLFTKFYHE